MSTATATAQIALLGNPNCGKSTLFNSLTGARAKVMNAPGTTVSLQTGQWHTDFRSLEVVDLPGTYSLTAHSPDEQVTADYLLGAATVTPASAACAHCGPGTGLKASAHLHRPDVALVVLDATGLARSLYLLAQILDTGIPVVAAVSMLDVASARGVEPDLTALAESSGVPVVAIDPRTGTGVEALGATIARMLATSGRAADLPVDLDTDATDIPRDLQDQADAHFAWVERVMAAALPGATTAPVHSWSDRVDRVLLHPWWGVPVFGAVLWSLFQLATLVATPLIEAVGQVIHGPVATGLRAVIPGTGGWLESLLVDGVLTGVGTVLSFAPLLALIFLAIGLLEDSGYLARAAFVADRALRRLGLDGRAMVPLVIGFGCNVPALAATRTMPDARRRLLTGLLIPFTSCPARLTVYVLVAGVFFPRHVGTVVFAMYVISALLVVLGGLALRATLFRDLAATRPLVLALPAYHVPKLGYLAQNVGLRVWAFIKGAGGFIAGMLVVVWLLTALPLPGVGARFAQVPVTDSVYGRVAQTLAPALAPAGLEDWRISSALLTGFVAKEVMVGSLAQSFALNADQASAAEAIDETRPPDWLASRLRDTLVASSGGHATAAAWAFMVYVLAYTPCLATVAEQKRIFGWRWALGGTLAQLAVAWLLAVVTFQALMAVT
ncbi:MAG: ferrous iron transporter B [Cellulomonadaceae bacterium]|nr:ferrous iron transporter B [Cellulomonadaceae bacterium]